MKNIIALRRTPDLNHCKKFLSIEESDIVDNFEREKTILKAPKIKNSLNYTSPAFYKEDIYSDSFSLKSMKFPFYEGNNQNIQKLYLKKNIFISRKYHD